ncbi:hypothetical protein LH128_07722 [Sphingomonas sp. LH128]|uniref:hypothetical protein n=1 Tax=Sphingomonas sp. LH128 TaxID=473781 RepID=UPI00027CC753|nr:hypothetical protein [Sphingomonas sp. LH128]EJU13636.1 hypothetical protein LH128_07722 [Sphingomonas sp. LH128]
MVPTCLFEAGTLGGSVLLTCKCGHTARFHAPPLWWHFQRRHWDDGFVEARKRFWCRVCGSRLRARVRPISIEGAVSMPGDFELPWPDERTWKAACRRVR